MSYESAYFPECHHRADAEGAVCCTLFNRICHSWTECEEGRAADAAFEKEDLEMQKPNLCETCKLSVLSEGRWECSKWNDPMKSLHDLRECDEYEPKEDKK